MTAGDCLPAVLSALTTQVENIARQDERANTESESIVVKAKVIQVENIERDKMRPQISESECKSIFVKVICSHHSGGKHCHLV